MFQQAYENIIIEGFNDAVSPEPRIFHDVDVVVGVAPGVAVFYDSKDFKRVIEAMAKLGKDPRSLRAKEVIKYVKVLDVLNIPPLSQEHLIDYDRLSEKLEEVIEHVKSSLEA